MSSIIIVFPKLDDAKRIRDILQKRGFLVDAVCSTAAQALSEMNLHDGGIVICGYKMPDMFCTDLKECMPATYELLLIASGRVLSTIENSGIVCISMPLSVTELAETLQMMQYRAQAGSRRRKKLQPKKIRSETEQHTIDNAKQLLMERNHMTEAEAHRYIQKCSMDSGTNLVETAEMILTLMDF